MSSFAWEGRHCPCLCPRYKSSLDYHQRHLRWSCKVSKSIHITRTWAKTLDSSHKPDENQAGKPGHRVSLMCTVHRGPLILEAIHPGSVVWWISVRVVTTNLLNEKLVEAGAEFCSLWLFHLHQGVKKRSQKINLNLHRFSVTKLGCPADFCLVAEILGLPFLQL